MELTETLDDYIAGQWLLVKTFRTLSYGAAPLDDQIIISDLNKRQCFTNGSRSENITGDEIETMMNPVNHRPRKTLNFKPLHTVFLAEPLQEAV